MFITEFLFNNSITFGFRYVGRNSNCGTRRKWRAKGGEREKRLLGPYYLQAWVGQPLSPKQRSLNSQNSLQSPIILPYRKNTQEKVVVKHYIGSRQEVNRTPPSALSTPTQTVSLKCGWGCCKQGHLRTNKAWPWVVVRTPRWKSEGVLKDVF